MAQTLCPNCGLYDIAAHAWSRTSYTMTEARRLLDGERAGCDVCALAVSAIRAWQPGWLTGANLTAKIRVKARKICLSVMLWPGTDEEKELLVCLNTESGRYPTGEDSFDRRRAVVADTRTQAAADRIASWLSDCVANHAGCDVAALVADPAVAERDADMSAAATFMPRRILDLEGGGNRCGSDDRIWLVDGPPNAAPYAALSYCWGPDLKGVLQTVRSNVQAHMRDGIPTASLPQTIQDAVAICRRISNSKSPDSNGHGHGHGHCRIRYLWVDALCIVQDDAADWQQEASTMCSVFQFSHVTLVARMAASCHQGFLGPQMLGQPSHQAVWEWTPPSSTSGTPPTPMILCVVDKASQDAKWCTQPLDTRAWTLQEIVLPRRLVHFTGNQMYWECQTACLDETTYVGLAQKNGSGISLYSKWGRGWQLKTELQSALRQAVLVPQERIKSGKRTEYRLYKAHRTGWMTLVEGYSRRQLTNPSDKLVAIDGLAQIVGIVGEWAQATPGSGTLYVQAPGRAMAAAAATYHHSQAYVCGLFRSDLVRQLLWSVDDERAQGTGAGTRSPQLPAPSWSWASVQTAVRFRGRLIRLKFSSKYHKALVTVDDIELGTDAYGRTGTDKGAALVVTGDIVFVAARTAVWPSKEDTIFGVGPANRRRGRISVVRPVGGTSFEVSFDDTGPEHVPELATSDAGFACWVGPQTRDTGEYARHVERMPASIMNSGSAAAVRDYDTRHGFLPKVGCQFPPDSHRDQPEAKAKAKWCSLCAIPAPQEEYCCLRIFQVAFLYDVAVYYLVLRRSQSVPGAWQRVGIGIIKKKAGEVLFDGHKRETLRII